MKKLVFLFIMLVFLFFILFFFTLKIQLRIERVNFSSEKYNGKHIRPNYKINVIFYCLEKIPILNLEFNKEKIRKIKNKQKFNQMIKKINEEMIENHNKIDNSIWKGIKDIKFEIKNLDLYIELGTEDAAFTAILVPAISTLLSFLFKRYIIKLEKQKFQIRPVYYNKNVLNFQLEGIIEIKMIHIINTICLIKKERRSEKDERTSNRRTYDHSYEQYPRYDRC